MKKQKYDQTGESLWRYYFPYGIRRLPNGKYFIFNREYQPLGCTRKVINSIYGDIPEEYCVDVKLTDKMKSHLHHSSFDTDAKPENIFLYNDASNPMQGKEARELYLRKLSILIEMRILFSYPVG